MLHPVPRLLLVIAVLIASACAHVRTPSAAETLRCIQPTGPIDAGAPQYTWGTTGGDVWVARYEPRLKSTAWKTRVGGTDTSITSVAKLNEDEIAVTGATAARSLPGLDERGIRERGGFVLKLSASRGDVLSGSYVNDPGTEIHSVASMRDGRVLVAGTGGTEPGYGVAPLPRIRQVWAERPDRAPAQRAFLSVYTPDLRREVGRLDLGEQTERRPRVWLDCNGNPVVGTVAIANGQCAGGWPDLAYQQGKITENYDVDHDWNQTATLGTPPGGWGFHALRWKAYHSGAALDWSSLSSPSAVPRWGPMCSDAQTLNALENTQFNPPDPPGGWNCGQHTGMADLALTSAFLFSRWTTPVYTDVKRWSNLNGPWTEQADPVALERVVFHPVCPSNPNAYTGQKLEDLCNFNVDDVANVGCTAVEGLGGVAGNGFYLLFDHFEGAKWYTGGLVWYLRPVGYVANPGPYFWQQWYKAGDYIFDPPEGTEREQAAIQQAARQLASAVVRPGRVVVTTMDLGSVTSRQTIAALVPAND